MFERSLQWGQEEEDGGRERLRAGALTPSGTSLRHFCLLTGVSLLRLLWRRKQAHGWTPWPKELGGSIVIAYYSLVPWRHLEAGALPRIQTQLCLLTPWDLPFAGHSLPLGLSFPICSVGLFGGPQPAGTDVSLTGMQEMAETGAHKGPQEHPTAACLCFPACKSLGTPISALTLTDTWGLGSLPGLDQ